MPTTTVCLSKALAARIARIAGRDGISAHGFMLSAIVGKVERAERCSDFHLLAEQRHAEILATGKTIAWADMQVYLRERIKGNAFARPRIRKRGQP